MQRKQPRVLWADHDEGKLIHVRINHSEILFAGTGLFPSNIETQSLATGVTDAIHDRYPINETNWFAMRKLIDAVLCVLGFRSVTCVAIHS